MTDKQDTQTTPKAASGQTKASKPVAPKLAQSSVKGGRMASILALSALLLAAYASYQAYQSAGGESAAGESTTGNSSRVTCQ